MTQHDLWLTAANVALVAFLTLLFTSPMWLPWIWKWLGVL